MDGDVGLDEFQVAPNEVGDSFGLFLRLWCRAPIGLLTWVLSVRRRVPGDVKVPVEVSANAFGVLVLGTIFPPHAVLCP